MQASVQAADMACRAARTGSKGPAKVEHLDAFVGPRRQNRLLGRDVLDAAWCSILSNPGHQLTCSLVLPSWNRPYPACCRKITSSAAHEGWEQMGHGVL